MRVLFASAELAPLARVGGLAEAASGLVAALRAAGVEIDLVLPDYFSTELEDERPRRVHDLSGVGPVGAVAGRLQVRLLHDVFGGVLDRVGRRPEDLGPSLASAGTALLGLALLGPLLGDAGDGAAERLIEPAHETTTADLPRSVNSTRGIAMCSSITTGSYRPARCSCRIASML